MFNGIINDLKNISDIHVNHKWKFIRNSDKESYTYYFNGEYLYFTCKRKVN